MKTPPEKPRPQERADTDYSLGVERSKADDAFMAARSAIESSADEAVEHARDHADARLRAARSRADDGLEAADASSAVVHQLATERAGEDLALADERATADERLHIEREQRRRALAKLLHLERETTDDRLELERLRSDETLAIRDDFLGMVSHDLRTLLGGIALNAALLSKHADTRGDDGDEVLRRADRIQRFTARMNRLVGDLLDVVSLEAGRLSVSPQQHDVAALVGDALESFAPAFAAKGLTLTSELAPGSLLASLDHERILQVLANLLSNALKFTPKGGAVWLRVALEGAEVRVSVIDSGVGVPSGELEGIFERFHQVQARDRRGLGLGLYISRCIVEAHGGKVWAELPPDGGMALHFTLPRATPPR